ncbi:response regulator transcription factor [Burkholderia diffusa]|uniref:response regulator transcription factor n=1 Tax=Burkholderia diffusa TaxID=488732 RepID=UPI00075ECA00|nr:response regulator transcription factor [Burkholderia diffusa]AOI59587.1 LuxR family transcriptional regulator [Burkholderia diffusa]KVC43058.1 LuxR family transcriptional regulator [Burkholderia diffusa]
MKIRVILSDDHPTVLSGVRHELSRAPTIEIVGTAARTDELVALLARTVCDVLITDYAMPGGDFVDGLPMLHYMRRTWPDMKIIVLTTIDNPAMLQEMAKSGVEGVLSKLDDVDHLIAAAHAVYAGATYYSPSVQARTAAPAVASPPTQPLTPREAEVIRLYVSGLSISEIATQLNRAKQTVSAQKIRAMKKLGIERDADLFQYAYETGLAASGTKGNG